MECDKEKLAIKSNEKGKMESEILKAVIKCDRKRKIKNSCFRQCPICKSPFWKKKDLEEHMADHGYEANVNSDEEKLDYELRHVIDTHPKTAGNKKRRAFCKTKAGSDIKWKYKEKDNVKRNILNHLSMIHGSYETIKKLVKML